MSPLPEELLPFYLNDTLGEAERREVERLAMRDASIADLLQTAQLLRDAAEAGISAHLTPVHSQILIEFAEDPDSLEPAVRERVAAACAQEPVLAEAVEILRSLGPLGPRSPGERRRQLWSAFRSSFLHPAPALAYLLIVVVLLPLAWRGLGGRAPEQPTWVSAPQALPDAVRFRSSEDGPSPELSLDGARFVLAELITDLESSDRTHPDLALRLEFSRDSRVLYEETRAWSAIPPDGRVSLLLPASLLQPGGGYAIRLRVHRPGDLRHGELLYRSSFRVAN